MTWRHEEGRRKPPPSGKSIMRRLLGTSSGKRGRGADGTAIVAVKDKADVAAVPSTEWQLVEAPEHETLPRALPPSVALLPAAPRVSLLDTRLLNGGALKVLRYDTAVGGLSVSALNSVALPRHSRVCLLSPETHACSWLTGPATVGDILAAILDGDTRAADAELVRHTCKARKGDNARVLLLECPHCGSLSSVHSPTRCPRQELVGVHLVGVTAGTSPAAVYEPLWSPPACVEVLVAKDSPETCENTPPAALVACAR